MITRKQLTAMMINAIVVKMLITFPTALFEYCGNAAWLAVIYATAVAYGLFCVIRRVHITKASVIGVAEKIGGLPLKIAVGTAVFLVLSLNILSIIRTFPEIIRLVLLQKTYVEIIGTVFVLAIIFGASCGIEAIARVHEFFLPVAGVVLFAFIIMLLPDFEPKNILPFFGEGIYDILTKGSSCMYVFTDVLALNILIPYTKDLDSYKKSGSRAIIIGGACCFLILLAYGMCYVYPASANFIIPVYQLERLINLSDFFSRLEALFQFIWSISILLYTVMHITVLSKVWKETFNLRHSKPLIAPISIMLVGAAIIPKALDNMIRWERWIAAWIFIPAFLIPVIIGIVSRETIRKKTR